jgi:hypothetical protein
MSQSEIEQNILNAAKVLRHVHRETNALIASLDGALAGRGWQNQNKSWLGLWKTGAGLDATDNWMATILSRAYANPADPRRVILVEIYLAPANGGPPVIAMAGLSLAPESNANNLWDEGAWKWQQPGPWFDAADSVVKLDSEAMRRVVPKALRGCGRRVPLCGVDKTNLVELVVEPVLELVQSVPLE